MVTDKTGSPVRGLAKENFTVYENGVAQKIASFELSSEAPAGETQAPANAPRTIILLDQLNIRFADLAYARDQILKFLASHPIEHRLTALMAVGLNGLEMIQDYTRDGQLIENKLRELHAVTANRADGTIDPNWAADHANLALGALTQITRASVGNAYPINLIWVTSGFSGLLRASNSTETLNSGFRMMANLLIRSRMRLYTINPQGVVMKGNMAATEKAATRKNSAPSSSSAEQALDAAGNPQASADAILLQFTKMTGGLSFYERNDVDVALGEAISDGSNAYTLSYSPSNTTFNGEYRKIEVKTNVEGATARTRLGYYGVANEPAPDAKTRDVRLDTALSSPLHYSGFNVTCPATFNPSTRQLETKITVTPKGALSEVEEKQELIRAASFSATGKLLNQWLWTVNWKNPWTNRTVSTLFNKPLSPDARSVRFLVAEPTAQQIGTCEYRLP